MLRGHHLICLHFFSGEGYNPGFIENLRNVIVKARTGAKINVSPGADDICIRCPFLKDGSCFYREDAEPEIRAMDNTAMRLFHIKHGGSITWQRIGEIIPEIFSIWFEKYCSICSWRQICEKNDDYLMMLKEQGLKKNTDMGRLKIHFDQIQKAMEDISRDAFDYYLDLDSGKILTFSEEILQKVEAALCDEDIDEGIEYIEFDEEPELTDWMEDEVELALEILIEQNERYVRIPERTSASAYRTMSGFIETVHETVLRENLSEALKGKGAFRKFKDILIDSPKERKRWHGYNAKEMKKEIIAWLHSLGINPAQ